MYLYDVINTYLFQPLHLFTFAASQETPIIYKTFYINNNSFDFWDLFSGL